MGLLHTLLTDGDFREEKGSGERSSRAQETENTPIVCQLTFSQPWDQVNDEVRGFTLPVKPES